MSVDYAAIPGTADLWRDFSPGGGTLYFDAGQTRQFVTLSITADNIAEDDEWFTLKLSNPSSPAVSVKAPSQTNITILNDDVVRATRAAAAGARSRCRGPEDCQESRRAGATDAVGAVCASRPCACVALLSVWLHARGTSSNPFPHPRSRCTSAPPSCGPLRAAP